MDSCYECLRTNFDFLLSNNLNNVIPIIIGNLEKHNFTTKSDFEKRYPSTLYIQRTTISKYNIYTLLPFLVKFDTKGEINYAENIDPSYLSSSFK